MSNYDNTNRGQIWPNDRKEKDTHPDFKGSVNVEGVEYWVSAWKRKEGANPKAPSLRFSIQKKETQGGADKPQSEQPPAASGAAGDGFDDGSIPF